MEGPSEANTKESRSSLRRRGRSSKMSKLGSTLLNTFRIKPLHCFQQQVVENILQMKVPAAFENIIEYDFDDMAILCKYLNTDLLRTVNCIYWPSYKIVVVVHCLENGENNARGSLRYYWNPEFDGLASYKHETDYYSIIVTAAFFYYE